MIFNIFAEIKTMAPKRSQRGTNGTNGAIRRIRRPVNAVNRVNATIGNTYVRQMGKILRI